jgi:hypothetical protein
MPDNVAVSNIGFGCAQWATYTKKHNACLTLN